MVIPGLVVLVGAFLVLTATTTVLSFLLAMGLLGVGKGLFASPSRALVSDLFVENRGRALGIYTAGTDLGGLVAAGLSLAVVGGGPGRAQSAHGQLSWAGGSRSRSSRSRWSA